MTLPSLTQVSEITANTMKRFTLSVLAAYVAAILAIFLNHNNLNETSDLYGYMITAVFAFPLALAVEVFMESKKIHGVAQFFIRLVVLGLIGAAYYFVFRNLQEHFGMDWLRSFLMFLAATALIFFAPFICRGKANAFWQFAIALIVRIFQALVYFGILFLGIALLLASLDYLFQLDIDGEYYGDAWFVITGGLVSVFFLAGVPANYKSLDQTTAYPKFLRVLTEYFLVPLVSLFFLVLYAYSAKIIFNWERPMGGVAAWVMGFSTVGLITYFFIYSVKDKFLGYVEFFKKWFFVFLLPLLLVLALSIWVRIQEYGITQDRYFVVAFGIWALILAAFYLISRSKNLKFMAVSFFVIVVAMLYGPQSVFELPKASQLARLEAVMVNDGILVNGKVTKVDAKKIAQEDIYNINSILSYIVRNYGVEPLQPWFNENLSEIKTDFTYDYWFKVETIQRYIGIEMVDVSGSYMGNGNSNYRSFYVNNMACQKDKSVGYPASCVVEVSGYRYYLAMDLYGGGGMEYPHFFAGDKEYIAELKEGKILQLREILTGKVLLALDLQSFFDDFLEKYPNSQELAVENMTVNFGEGVLKINNISTYYSNDKFERIDILSFALLLR